MQHQKTPDDVWTHQGYQFLLNSRGILISHFYCLFRDIYQCPAKAWKWTTGRRLRLTVGHNHTNIAYDQQSRNFVSPHLTSLTIAPTQKQATYYNMSHEKRGLAVIFNHEIFNITTHMTPRPGTSTDCKNLTETLKTLDFDVTVHHNPTHRKIIEHLTKVANTDHSQYDCLMVVILSHGELDLLYARDTPYIPESLWSFFTSDRCPTLSGKPKLFIIQACQGERFDGGTTVKERTETDCHSTNTFRIPNHADFLIVNSTAPGFISWRNTVHGSWFIEALCLELRENGTRYDILTLLTFVVRRVALDYETKTPNDRKTDMKKQIPCITSMLMRLLHFKPKNPKITEV